MSQIICENNSRISFKSCKSVQITDMEYIGCGGSVIESVKQFIIQDTKFIGDLGSETALEIIGTNTWIIKCNFTANVNGKIKVDNKWTLGSAIIANQSTIVVQESEFNANRAILGGAVFAEFSSITLNKSSFRGNGLPGESASAGINTFTAGGAIWQKNSSLIIDSCCFEKMQQMMVEQCTH